MSAKLQFIAEIGSNYFVEGKGKSLPRALTLIEEAAAAGATAVKFQLIDKLYASPAQQARIDEISLPAEWLPELKAEADRCGVEFLVTPFSVEAVDLILPYVKRIKIASWDITFFPLLEKVRDTGLPVILSTGGADLEEVDEALAILRPGDEFPRDVTLMHCHAGYPTKVDEVNLRGIIDLAGATVSDIDEYEMMPVGLSSHCPDPEVNAAAVLYQAEIIEAHFDLIDGKGIEAPHSLNPVEFKRMVVLANKLLAAKGAYDFPGEKDREFARSNYRRNSSDWLRPEVR